MKRGHILSNDNNYYMLVRIESGVSAIDPRPPSARAPD